ncbi:hypothetical protein FRACYDRAFT_270824 [Fragilariopsis cylindrus CCMP1102]|uniref:peptide-methionine (S)-S-oxide reductase n=1 Tax=Fragilariopsis cylindrus CCMP1102 TaxID=635003 RepID=A0A1E7F0B9_9STRA|nr:hypothetical protein FRACYDRAFT_270824 [Fragilariopsis cylindrus CCMP1102]|eukprot:OEU11519.1 hypothetical protein FRACYDRAFT_270824 [Fragilariopsis cylindrus CCMP1102]
MRISINLSVNAFVVLCCLLAIQGINGYHFASPNQNKNVVQVSSTKKLSMESSLLSDDAETVQATTSTSSRRNLLRSVAAVSAGVMLGTIDVNPVNAADDVDVATPLYFGVGCFWHIQHEFVEQGEKQMLGRSIHEYTSATGYAGGKSADKEGRVWHGEVVGMTIPQSKIGDFSELYFSLYNPKTKDRVDPGDKGGEYRSLIGLPGGMSHVMYPSVENAAEKAGFKLVQGLGNDGDTLGKQTVWVYDSNKFPFYQGEIYHQYHNDFQSPNYGKDYNKLADLAFEEGRLKVTGCPDRV